jgi:hypothetical protein
MVAVLIVSSCSGSDEVAASVDRSSSEEVAGEDGSVGESPDEQNEEVGAVASEEDPYEVPPSPLLTYLGLLPEEDPGANDRAADTMVGCMAQQGFEWQPPAGLTSETVGFNGGGRGLDPDRDWVSVYGFGISTQTFEAEDIDPALVGMGSGDPPRGSNDDMAASGDVDVSEDPNAEYIASLSEGGRDAYFASLSDCQDEAAVEADRAIRNEAFVEQFGDDIADLFQQAETAPEVVEVEGEMMDCLAEEGYRFSTFQDMLDSVSLEVQELSVEVYNPGGASDEAEGAEVSGGAGRRSLTDEQNARLADIQQREVEMALAALECDASQERVWRAIDQAFYDLQAQYVEDHKDQLDAFLLSQNDS